MDRAEFFRITPRELSEMFAIVDDMRQESANYRGLALAAFHNAFFRREVGHWTAQDFGAEAVEQKPLDPKTQAVLDEINAAMRRLKVGTLDEASIPAWAKRKPKKTPQSARSKRKP